MMVKLRWGAICHYGKKERNTYLAGHKVRYTFQDRVFVDMIGRWVAQRSSLLPACAFGVVCPAIMITEVE